MNDLKPHRVAGVLIPLFSIRHDSSWGIGEIPDVARFSQWLALAGHGLLQVLPVNEVPPGETSPYSSLSAFAVDPIYICPDDLEDFDAAGGEGALDHERRRALDSVRAAPHVDYPTVRWLKDAAFRLAFDSFRSREYNTGSGRASDFKHFLDRHADWIHDYALFRALHRQCNCHWQRWEPALRDRQPRALDEARQSLQNDIMYFQYLQWQADRQWTAARQAAAICGVRLKGDLPFMVSGHSADVWAHQDQFRLDAAVGAPPDAFSATGQDWGLPAYNWEAMGRNDYDWLARRGRRAAQLYDMFRVDHVVGFFRTFTWPKDGSPPFFSPGNEWEQNELGRRLMGIFRSGGAEVIAEDLGTIPHFVRRSLTEMGISGYRVLRWEREWEQWGQPWRDPAHYPALSVAVSGTHDTDSMAVWWEDMNRDERNALCQVPSLRSLNPEKAVYFDATVHQALLETLYGAGSEYVILPVQDVFGARERVNIPGTVGPHNWTYRLPLTTTQLHHDSRGREATDRIAGCALRHGRCLYERRAA